MAITDDIFGKPGRYTCGHLSEGICDGCLEDRLDGKLVDIRRAVETIHFDHLRFRKADANCPVCVPSAFVAPTPEPVDYTLPACER